MHNLPGTNGLTLAVLCVIVLQTDMAGLTFILIFARLPAAQML